VDTYDHVIKCEDFNHSTKQEAVLLYEKLKPVLHTSICMRGVNDVLHISFTTLDRVWVSDFNNITLTNQTGLTLHRVNDIGKWYWRKGCLHTVNIFGELIYIDCCDNVKKLSLDNTIVFTLLEGTLLRTPRCVFCSPTTGDLLVGVYNTDTGTANVSRYSSTGEHVMTINALYNDPYSITENANGDVIVSDAVLRAVVVTDHGGRYRFSYTGPPSGSSLWPRGICTDALLHILVCDWNTHTVQMIDKDGSFLCLLLTQEDGINRPRSLVYDDKTHLLWVGSLDTNTISAYRYLHRRYSFTGKFQQSSFLYFIIHLVHINIAESV
jgi:hypothetical protein